jgi:hypothetical protein
MLQDSHSGTIDRLRITVHHPFASLKTTFLAQTRCSQLQQ